MSQQLIAILILMLIAASLADNQTTSINPLPTLIYSQYLKVPYDQLSFDYNFQGEIIESPNKVQILNVTFYFSTIVDPTTPAAKLHILVGYQTNWIDSNGYIVQGPYIGKSSRESLLGVSFTFRLGEWIKKMRVLYENSTINRIVWWTNFGRMFSTDTNTCWKCTQKISTFTFEKAPIDFYSALATYGTYEWRVAYLSVVQYA